MFLIVVVFDYVRLLDRSITERSIAFDLQNFFVSSIKFDYRTQSNPIERLGSISYAGVNSSSLLFMSNNHFWSCAYFAWYSAANRHKTVYGFQCIGIYTAVSGLLPFKLWETLA